MAALERFLINSTGNLTLENHLAEKYGEENVQLNADGSVTVTMPSGNKYVVTEDGNVTLLDGSIQEPEAEPISVSLDKTEITKEITHGESVTETITATLNNASGTLTWLSSDPDVAEIATSEGNTRTIEIKKAGTATITVTYAENTSIGAECTITVTEKEIALTVTPTTISEEIESGSTVEKTLTANLVNASGDLTWNSSNTTVASVTGNGTTATVTLKAEGTATITVSYEGTVSATCTVTVTEKEVGPTVAEVKNTVLSTTKNTDVYDAYGNKIVVPAGFKIKVDSTTNNADTVTEGIVVEDTSENQFVWIPVGKIYTDTAKTEANAKTITLGRYLWSGSIGTLMQPTADNPYTSDVAITSSSDNYIEYQSTSSTLNAKARNINDFYEGTIANSGYYLGRYEAGDSSNTAVANRTGSQGTSTAGTLVCKANQVPYNWITQPDASSKCQSMYANGYSSGTFSSDLINSYAWDTAIIFIQTFGTKSNSSTYASTTGKSSTSTSAPQKTGKNILNATNSVDEQLNIYDMAGNCNEWSTETRKVNTGNTRSVYRGGIYDYDGSYTRDREDGDRTYSRSSIAFRPLLYVGL